MVDEIKLLLLYVSAVLVSDCNIVGYECCMMIHDAVLTKTKIMSTKLQQCSCYVFMSVCSDSDDDYNLLIFVDETKATTNSRFLTGVDCNENSNIFVDKSQLYIVNFNTVVDAVRKITPSNASFSCFVNASSLCV